MSRTHYRLIFNYLHLGLALVVTWGACPTRAVADESWTQISTPYFTIISSASEGRTRAWATEFELFRRGLQDLLPLDAARLMPVSIVLFGSDGAFRPFLPLDGGKPAVVGGYLFNTPNRTYIALSVAGARDDTRPKIYGGAMHWYLAGFDRRPPDWLEQGLVEVFGSFSLQGPAFTIGAPRPEYLRLVKILRPMPFAQFAAFRRGNLKTRGPTTDETSRFYAQSWLAVHELLFAPESPGLPAVRAFLAQPPSGETDALKEIETAFGRNAAQMDARLLAHIDRRYTAPMKVTLDRSAVEAGFRIEPASAAEVDLALGRLFVGVKRPEEAGAYLWRAVVALPEDPRVHEALGAMEMAAGRSSEGLAHFRDAIAKGDRSFFAHYVIAFDAVNGQLSSPGGFGGYSEADFRPALEHLEACLGQNPRFIPAYEALAAVFAMVTVRTHATELEALLREGARRAPENAMVQLALGFLAMKQNDVARAREFQRRAAELAPETRLFRNLSERLQEKIAAYVSPEDAAKRAGEMAAALVRDAFARKAAAETAEKLPPTEEMVAKFEEKLKRARQMIVSGQPAGGTALLEEMEEKAVPPGRKPDVAAVAKMAGDFQALTALEGMVNSGVTELAIVDLEEMLKGKPEPEVKAQAEKLLARARQKAP